MTDEQKWETIIHFLDEELKVKEQMLLFENCYSAKNEGNAKPKNDGKEVPFKSFLIDSKVKNCTICDRSDHVATVTARGNLIINYFACEKFAKMSPKERFDELKKKDLCFQCLSPGLKAKHAGNCFEKFMCPNESHKRFKSGLHVLICDEHKTEKANLALLEAYKAKYIASSVSSHCEFSTSISLHVDEENGSYKVHGEYNQPDELDTAIYMLQTIRVDNQDLNIFLDSGCGDMVCRKMPVDWLKNSNRAKRIVRWPLVLSGVGDKKSICEHGRYQITIPLHDGENINLSGICLDKITSEFPLSLK